MFTLKKHLFPLVFCFCWKGRPLSNEQRQRLVPAPWQRHGGRSYSNSSPNWRGKAYGWGSWKHNVWWISQSLGDFLWDVIFFWSWKSMKYVMHIYIYDIQMNIYIYFIHLFVTYYIHMNFMWICIILIKRDGVLDIFQQKSKTSMVSCGVWSEEENSRPKREGDSQIFIFPFG